MPQLTAIHNVAEALKGTGVPLIADGGIRFSGDIAKAPPQARTASCSAVCLPTRKKPRAKSNSTKALVQILSRYGLLGAMSQGSADRYFQDKTDSTDKYVPEGIEGAFPTKARL